MMDRRIFIGAAAMLPSAALLIPAAAIAKSSALRAQVLGLWQIIDAETVNAKTGASAPWLGRKRPYSGTIIYLPNGMMSVQIGAARAPSRADAGPNNMSNEEKIGLFDTYYAYHGRFEIDEAQSKVRHFVEHSLFEFESGRTLVRTIRLSGKILTLSTDNLQPGPDGPTFARLRWTRVLSLPG